MSVSVCVCPRSYVRNYTSDLNQWFVYVTTAVANMTKSTVPLSLIRSTVTASVRRPGGGGGTGSAPSKSATVQLLLYDPMT